LGESTHRTTFLLKTFLLSRRHPYPNRSMVWTGGTFFEILGIIKCRILSLLSFTLQRNQDAGSLQCGACRYLPPPATTHVFVATDGAGVSRLARRQPARRHK
jgi:hypothetical protein